MCETCENYTTVFYSEYEGGHQWPNYFCCLGHNIGEKCAEYVKATVDSDEDDI